MANRFQSPVRVADFNPQAEPVGQLATVPRQFDGSQATATMGGIAQKLADKFGRIADQAAQVEGQRAGAIAGQDPNFRPSGSFTIKGRAADAAAIEVYASSLTAKLNSDMADAFDANRDNPAGFAVAAQKLRQTYQRDHVFPEVASEFNNRFAGLELAYRTKVGDNYRDNLQSAARGKLNDDLSTSGTNRTRLLAAGDTPDTRSQLDLSLADDDARIDGQVSSGAITPEQGAELKRKNRQNAATDLAVAGAGNASTPEEIEAYRERLKADFIAGKTKDLDGDSWQKIDNALSRLATSRRSGQNAAVSDLSKSMNEYLGRMTDGLTPSAAELAVLTQEANALGPAGQSLLQEFGERQKLATMIAGNSTETVEAFLDRLVSEGRGSGAGPRFNYANVGNMGDPRSADWVANNITSIEAGGANWQVNKQAAGAFQGFLNDLAAEGYDLKSSGGYNLRAIRGSRTGKLSQHSWGNAIDIDAPNNAMGSRATNLPANTRELAAKWGLAWGMDMGGRPDPMHFEWMGPGGGGISPALGARVQWARKLIDQKRKDESEDPLGAAAKNGIVTDVRPYDPDAEDAPEQLSKRVSQAQAVAQETGRSPTYLRPDEKRRLSARLAAGGDDGLNVMQGIVRGGQEAAPAILKELGTEAPVMAQIGAVLAEGGSVPAMRDAMAAVKLKKDGSDLPTPPKGIMKVTADTMGRALDLNPDERGRITQLANLIYGARATRLNVQPDDDAEAEKLYTRSIQEAGGATFSPGGQQFGGFIDIGGGFFGSRPAGKVAVPAGMSAELFPKVLDNLRDEDLADLRVPPVSADGKPFHASDLAATLPVRYGSGYRFQVTDPQTGEPSYIRGQDGRPFVLPTDRLREVATARHAAGDY